MTADTLEYAQDECMQSSYGVAHCPIKLSLYRSATQRMLHSCSNARPIKKIFILFIVTALFFSCTSTAPGEPALFEVLDQTRTGIDFSNTLKPDSNFNVLDYMYFYNGAGTGAADFNNDGLTDLFFAANQSNNKLFLNAGDMHFKDVSAAAQLPQDNGWSTGVSVVDINNDGLLDIYVCRVGNFEILKSKNQLLVCQGIDKSGVPYYKDEAREYGLDFSGFSTQAAFFDYDMDGDLDMFLLNHSVHQNGTFAERNRFLGTYNEVSGDRIYRNDFLSPSSTVENKSVVRFTDVTKETGINSSAIGYGLGVCIADIDIDGWPDIYVGNDFHENDYLYINQHNGTFKETSSDKLMHTSQFSMGVDVADINNDAYPEIISMDMLPADPVILKRSLGEDNYDLFYEKIRDGYSYQYTRNNLQLNMRNGVFSEVGLYAGVAATDWSWAPLWVDFDNDGLKDLFISNGIPKRMNDIDYANFVSDDATKDKMAAESKGQKDMALIEKFPQIKLPNKFFKNEGGIKFKDLQDQIKNDQATYSNGAVYADFDNDGDLDIAVNNIDGAALIYQNKSNDKKDQKFLQITFKGSAANIHAAGSKIFVFAGSSIRAYEKYPVHGFLSAMETPLQIGLDKIKVDSVLLVWPDNTYEQINWNDTSHITVTYKAGLPQFNYSVITGHWKNITTPMTDITQATGINFKHEENPFNEFDREQLIPHMVSREGPAIAAGDINHDGLEDVFIGSSKRTKSAVFLQQATGKFYRSVQPALDKDSLYEEAGAVFTDVNNDGNIDLVAASGGNEFFGHDEHNTPRVYLNDGKANFTRLANAFDTMYVTASGVVPYDFNGDGFIDLFIGGRAVPYQYGKIPSSFLLQNDGTGKFKNVTKKYAKELQDIGFVTNAIWLDIDKDGDKDLVLSLEWGGITAFINNKGTFAKKILSDKNGWWNFILPCDIDNDGDTDFVAGNLGLNSRLHATAKEPVRLYYRDFDNNGKTEQVLTYYLNGREIPFANIAELEKQLPVLKKKYLYAADFAKASLEDLFTADNLQAAQVLTADYFSSSVLINNGNLNFTTRALPWQAQLSPYKDAVVINANNDSLPDILLVGNFYENNIEMGRYDADYGTILINKGNGNFECGSINGLQVKGQVRHIQKIEIGKQDAFILAKNNDSVMVIQQAVNK